MSSSAVPAAAGASVRSGRVDRSGLAAAGALAVLLAALSWLRHQSFWSGAFDLGIFDQAVWQLAHGRDAISLVDRRVFADHFSPVLLLFVPLYRIAATPAWLLAGQALALGATVLPLRALARDLAAPPAAATWLTAASSPLLAAALFDFHPSTLAVPFIATTILYGRRDRTGPALAGSLGVALCRADLGLTVVAAAIVAGRRTRLPLVLSGVAMSLLGAVGPGLFGETNGWAPHFGHLGDGPLDAALHPWVIVGALVSSEALRPLLVWLLAAGAIVVLRPRWLGALLVAGLPILLSRWGATGEPWFHYGAPMVPFAIGGTLDALGQARDRSAAWRRRVAPIVVVAPVLVLATASPLSPSAPDQFQLWVTLSSPSGWDAEAAIEQVEPGEVVSADNRLVPHLAHREQVFMFPLPFGMIDGFFAPDAEPDLDHYPSDLIDVVIATQDTVDGRPIPGYVVVDRVPGFVVLRRVPERANIRSSVDGGG